MDSFKTLALAKRICTILPPIEIILHGIRILGNRHHRLKLRFSILSLNQGSVRSRKDSEAVPFAINSTLVEGLVIGARRRSAHIWLKRILCRVGGLDRQNVAHDLGLGLDRNSHLSLSPPLSRRPRES